MGKKILKITAKTRLIASLLLTAFVLPLFTPCFGIEITGSEYKTDAYANQVGIFNENILKINKLKVSQDLQTLIQNINPDKYIVDTGDKFKINVYGPVNDEFILAVNPDGKIVIPDFGEIYVRCLTYRHFKQKMSDFLNKFYRNCRYSITLVSARTFKIEVTGEVARPGSYMVNSFYSVIDLLGEAGGLNPNASMFNIMVRNKNKERHINAYKTVFLGEAQEEYSLLADDLVYVPPIKNPIKIKGEVNRPGLYELTKNENLNDAIKLAAGFTYNASPEDVFIEREINNGIDKQIMRVNLMENKETVALAPGDVIVIPGKEIYQKYITLAGEFKAPETSSKLSVLRNQKLEEKGYSQRWNYKISRGERVMDVINSCGGVTDRANLKFAQVCRLDEKGEKSMISVNLNKLIYKNDLSQNIELLPGDMFIIPPQLDSVFIIGELRTPGAFPYMAGYTLREYIVMAGGPGGYANLGNVKIIRGDPQNPDVTTVNLSSAFIGRRINLPPIQPEDIIFVPRTEVVSYKDILGIIQNVVNLYALVKIFQ